MGFCATHWPCATTLTSLSDALRDTDSDRYTLSQPNPSSLCVLPTLHGDGQQSPSKPEHHLIQVEPLLDVNLYMKVG